MSRRPANLVPDPVHHGLTQVRLERGVHSVLEHVDSLQGVDDGFLDQIVGVCDVARPVRQPSARPPLEERNLAGEDGIEGASISFACSREQLHGAPRRRHAGTFYPPARTSRSVYASSVLSEAGELLFVRLSAREVEAKMKRVGVLFGCVVALLGTIRPESAGKCQDIPIRVTLYANA